VLNKDYKEMLQSLLKNEVEFLVVGAYAMGAQGYPRATGDFDIWAKASAINSRKIYKALADFGAPVSNVTDKTFIEKDIIFQIGIMPRRIDIITHIDGVDFKDAYTTRLVVEIDGLKIPFLSKENIIKNKLASGRPKDRLDVEYLKEVSSQETGVSSQNGEEIRQKSECRKKKSKNRKR